MSATIAELITRHDGSLDNVPTDVLYDFVTSPETIASLRNLAREHNRSGARDVEACLAEFKSQPFVHSVRKRFVTDPSFSASMSPELRADMAALFFPECANA